MLTCTTKTAMDSVLKQLWINYIKVKHAEDKNLVGNGTIEYDSLSDFTDDQIATLKIYGVKNGVIQKILGITTQYDNANKANNLDLWYIEEPPLELMTGVINYSIQSYNSEWSYDED